MRTIHLLLSALLLVAMVFLPAASDVHSASGPSSTQAAGEAWINKTFAGDFDIGNISTANGGPLDIPMFSYAVSGQANFKLAHPVVNGTAGNCGPSNTWQCDTYAPGNVTAGTISDVAAYSYSNSFLVGWAYQGTDGNLWVYYQEFDQQFTPLGSVHTYMLMDIGDPDYSQYHQFQGRPSMVFDNNGYPRVALVTHNIDQARDELWNIVRIYPTTSNNCGFSSYYDCQRIVNRHIISDPLLGLNLVDYGSAILFLDNDADALVYAHPDTYPGHHADCGPSYTWRCVTIDQGGSQGMISTRYAMAQGYEIGSLNPYYFLYTYTSNMMGQPNLVIAKYVGGTIAGGNCGQDYNFADPPVLEYLWKCTTIYTYTNAPAIANVWFSLQVDEKHYPVVAHNSDNTIPRVQLDFPAARAGGALSGNCVSNTWYCQTIFSSSIESGREMALLLNRSGLGFLVFIEDREYEPYVWTSRQFYRTFLPVLWR